MWLMNKYNLLRLYLLNICGIHISGGLILAKNFVKSSMNFKLIYFIINLYTFFLKNNNIMSALRRLKKEYAHLMNNSTDDFKASPINDSDYFHWIASINGPKSSPYEGGIFHLNIHYSTNYPFYSPAINFETRIFHPNINENGHIFIENFKFHWSPAYTIYFVLTTLQNFLSEPDFQNSYIAEKREMSKEEYVSKAHEWTLKYADGNNKNNTLYCLNGEKRIQNEIQNIIFDNEKYKINKAEYKLKYEASIFCKKQKYDLIFDFPENYPYKPPKLNFKSDNEFLKNNLDICNSILEHKWNYRIFIKDIFSLIFKIFSNTTIESFLDYKNDDIYLDLKKSLENEKEKNKNLERNIESLTLKNNEQQINLKSKINELENLVNELITNSINNNDNSNNSLNLIGLKEPDLSHNKNNIDLLKSKILNEQKDKLEISIIIKSDDQNIEYSTICKKIDIFEDILKELYEKYPEYFEITNHFLLNGKEINIKKSLIDNNINHNDIIILKTMNI